MRHAGGDEQKVTGGEGHRFIAHFETAMPVNDDIAFVVAVRLL
jgi:hypothetical protein